jgi:hypothetical protein
VKPRRQEWQGKAGFVSRLGNCGHRSLVSKSPFLTPSRHSEKSSELRLWPRDRKMRWSGSCTRRLRERIHQLRDPRYRAEIRGRHIALRNREIEFSLDRQHQVD